MFRLVFGLAFVAAVCPSQELPRVRERFQHPPHEAGRHRGVEYKLLNSRYGARFQPQDLDNLAPVPAGLLGPSI
jgi:hypothetical protein